MCCKQNDFPFQQSVFDQKHLPRLSQVSYPNMEQPYRMNAHNQVQMRQPMSVVDQELAQLFVKAFPQFFQSDVYPVWAYLPQNPQTLKKQKCGETLN
ncbi:alpha-S1-casein precursor [Sigmodon hispidus]